MRGRPTKPSGGGWPRGGGTAPCVDLADVRRAAEAIAGGIVATPSPRSRTLSEITGAEVVLKLENLQFTASFKDRGALVKLLSLGAAERARGVIAMSAGNHAQAVAYHARRLGIAAAIVMPRTTPNVKVEHTGAFGAEVILHGDGLDEAAARARRLAAERGLVLVHPYDDRAIIAGQGTIALELLAAEPDLEVLVVPVGGGGLIAGIAVAAKALKPGIEIVGVEAARFPAMRQALRGEPVACGAATIADGIAVKEPGRLTLPIVRALVDDILLVEEDAIEEAVLLLLEVEKTVVEGAGAVGLAALRAHRPRFAGRRAGVVLSGGNIDPLVLSAIIQRGLVRSGRLARLRVDLRDVPSALAEVAARIGAAGANIVEVHHQRAFGTVPLKSAEVELVLETRGREHLREVVAALAEAGYAPRLPDAAPGGG
jgi:threonine dehydratase